MYLEEFLMAVYVDPLFECVPRGRWRWNRSCHMWADSDEELHELASKIGLRREWFQKDARLPHYDLRPARRAAAVANGAVQVSRRKLAERLLEQRKAGITDGKSTG